MIGRARWSFFEEAAGALRIAAFSWILLAGIYTILLAGFSRVAAPFSSRGSLLRNGEGALIGSALIAQSFVRPGYFWPRPSAVGYDASAAGGSNLRLRARNWPVRLWSGSPPWAARRNIPFPRTFWPRPAAALIPISAWPRRNSRPGASPRPADLIPACFPFGSKAELDSAGKAAGISPWSTSFF